MDVVKNKELAKLISYQLLSTQRKERWDAGDPYYEPGKPWDPYEAYEALLSGTTFDDTLFTLAEDLRELEKEPLPWLAVMSRATLDIPI